MLRAALVEYNFYHGETMPTIVSALNQLGIDVDCYGPTRLLRNNPFVYTKGLRFSFRSTEALAFRLWTGRRHFGDYDLLVVNSLEPKEHLRRAEQASIPTIGVVHHGAFLQGDPDYVRFFANPSRRPIVLAEHVSRYLAHFGQVEWLAPVYLGEFARRRPATPGPIRFCVQGNLEFDRRNYVSLIDAVDAVVTDGYRNLEIVHVGRNDPPYGPDGPAFKAMVRERHLEEYFRYTEGDLPYREYYGAIADSAFLLPLLDTTDTRYSRYFHDQGTTSALVSIGIACVPVIHTELASLYGLGQFSIQYADGELDRALRRALELSEQELEACQAGLKQRRDHLMTQATANLGNVLAAVGLPSDANPPSISQVGAR
jgi:hypothetical protein